MTYQQKPSAVTVGPDRTGRARSTATPPGHGGMAVPFREVVRWTRSAAEPPFRLYDTSGRLHGRGTATIDLAEAGLPRVRAPWLERRGFDYARTAGNPKPEDNGHTDRLVPECPAPLRTVLAGQRRAAGDAA